MAPNVSHVFTSGFLALRFLLGRVTLDLSYGGPRFLNKKNCVSEIYPDDCGCVSPYLSSLCEHTSKFLHYYYLYYNRFVNLSMSALGAFDKSCDSLLSMLNDLETPYNLKHRIILKIMNISI